MAVAVSEAIVVVVNCSSSRYCARNPPERSSCELFRRDRRKMRRNFGEIFRRFSSFNFQGKWPQKFHEKSSTFSTVHQIKFFHCCNSGGLGAQQIRWHTPKIICEYHGQGSRLSGPLDRLNAILSLLHPFDRYRTPSAIGSATGKALSRIPTQVRVQPRDSGAILSKTL